MDIVFYNLFWCFCFTDNIKFDNIDNVDNNKFDIINNNKFSDYEYWDFFVSLDDNINYNKYNICENKQLQKKLCIILKKK